ncbi:hypothetical protein HK101_010653, partial [Irineochytrium annulatum]
MVANYRATIGADFITKEIVLKDENRTILVQLWDTAACSLVYDVTNAASLANLPNWLSEFLVQADITDPDTFPIAVIGNKIDADGERVVTMKQGRDMARTLRQTCIEIGRKRRIELEAYRLRAAEAVVAAVAQGSKIRRGKWGSTSDALPQKTARRKRSSLSGMAVREPTAEGSGSGRSDQAEPPSLLPRIKKTPSPPPTAPTSSRQSPSATTPPPHSGPPSTNSTSSVLKSAAAAVAAPALTSEQARNQPPPAPAGTAGNFGKDKPARMFGVQSRPDDVVISSAAADLPAAVAEATSSVMIPNSLQRRSMSLNYLADMGRQRDGPDSDSDDERGHAFPKYSPPSEHLITTLTFKSAFGRRGGEERESHSAEILSDDYKSGGIYFNPFTIDSDPRTNDSTTNEDAHTTEENVTDGEADCSHADDEQSATPSAISTPALPEKAGHILAHPAKAVSELENTPTDHFTIITDRQILSNLFDDPGSPAITPTIAILTRPQAPLSPARVDSPYGSYTDESHHATPLSPRNHFTGAAAHPVGSVSSSGSPRSGHRFPTPARSTKSRLTRRSSIMSHYTTASEFSEFTAEHEADDFGAILTASKADVRRMPSGDDEESWSGDQQLEAVVNALRSTGGGGVAGDRRSVSSTDTLKGAIRTLLGGVVGIGGEHDTATKVMATVNGGNSGTAVARELRPLRHGISTSSLRAIPNDDEENTPLVGMRPMVVSAPTTAPTSAATSSSQTPEPTRVVATSTGATSPATAAGADEWEGEAHPRG